MSFSFSRYIDLMIRVINDDVYCLDNVDNTIRLAGGGLPRQGFSMIGSVRLENVARLSLDVIRNNIPGDLIETGVWRGGACILMNAVVQEEKSDKRVILCDSFQGLPKPRLEEDRGDTHWKLDHLRVSEEEVLENFRKCNLLTSNVLTVKGWFNETLPKLSIDNIALLRLDGDMYESTYCALENLYPKLSVGGYVIIDDWTINGAYRATLDYRKKHGICEEILDIHSKSLMDAVDSKKSYSIYWKKTA